jgi:hypothetical protein
MTLRAALSALGACWLAACSFPDYRFVTEPAVDPLASVCTDGLPSDAETGVDCGGGCPPCAMGEPCVEHQDCESMACGEGICQMPTCDDGVKNGSETDSDCGGQCQRCGTGRDCKQNADCLDRVCVDDRCQLHRCDDGVLNGAETSIDCGGDEGCDACQIGDACTVDDDCVSDKCSQGVCVAPGCTDNVLNGNETDVDCGGDMCGPCQAGQHCTIDDECLSMICDADQECTAAACDDDVKNGEESAVDCGGGQCDGCPNLQVCATPEDCASDACQSGLCVPATPTGSLLTRQGWVATASDSFPDADPNQVLDSSGPRWSSGIDQYEGMWFEVDMAELRAFYEVEMVSDQVADDFPIRYDVLLSSDGTFDEPAAAGLFGTAGSSTATFDTAQVARYVRIVITQSKDKWWSIDELRVLQ